MLKIERRELPLVFVWLISLVTYFLGLAISDFLGKTLDWEALLLGLIWLLVNFICGWILFKLGNSIEDNPETFQYMMRTGSTRNLVMAAGMALVLLVVLTSQMAKSGMLGPVGGVLMLVVFVLTFLTGLRPLRLYFSGFGELVLAVLAGFLIPVFGLILQMGELHRLISFVAVPLTLILFSFQIIFQIVDFGDELKKEVKRLAGRIGWENSFLMHNSFLILAYLVLGVAGFMGFPRSVALPAMLSLPLAGLQVWHLQTIARGGKPRWKFLELNNYLLVGSFLISLIVAFFIR